MHGWFTAKENKFQFRHPVVMLLRKVLCMRQWQHFSVIYYSYTQRVSAAGTMNKYHHKNQQVKLIYSDISNFYTKYKVSIKIAN